MERKKASKQTRVNKRLATTNDLRCVQRAMISYSPAHQHTPQTNTHTHRDRHTDQMGLGRTWKTPTACMPRSKWSSLGWGLSISPSVETVVVVGVVVVVVVVVVVTVEDNDSSRRGDGDFRCVISAADGEENDDGDDVLGLASAAKVLRWTAASRIRSFSMDTNWDVNRSSFVADWFEADMRLSEDEMDGRETAPAPFVEEVGVVAATLGEDLRRRSGGVRSLLRCSAARSSACARWPLVFLLFDCAFRVLLARLLFELEL